ncbi:MAG: alpha-glucosidase [Spirosomataceae bacterium]
MQKNWWKEAVVYQIYPRSFQDSNADGIGDLQGITSRLPYLQELGIDVIWLSPHYQSPNTDNGYDISDYENIMEEFGTMADFDEMLDTAHRLGLKLIIDLVVNHSSDEHRWFQAARQSTDNPYRHYYSWKKEIPNDWISFFSGSAWEFDSHTQEYYLHLFAKKQPDLNWENEQLRQEIYQMMRFWLDKGVDGFRMDVISLISKDPAFASFPADRFGDLSYYANGPRVHEFLQEMNAQVLSKYDCMSVGEAFGVSSQQALDYVGEHRKELQMIYHFDHAVPREEPCFAQPKPEWTLVELKAIVEKWDKALAHDGWNTVYFGNHDNPRMLSRFGNAQQYHYESATMLATLLLTLRGTPYLYQGDEIGMTNYPFEHVSELNDVQVVNAYDALVRQGNCTEEQFLKAVNQIARDHARTPMQWNAEKNAGFSAADTTWLKVNPNYTTINVSAQQAQPHSILNYYKQLIALRKETPTLLYGTYEDLLPTDNSVWAFKRVGEEQSIVVLCNFTNQEQPLPVPVLWPNVLISNYMNLGKNRLRPYEAILIQTAM